MAAVPNANPTGVSSFTGRSDDSKGAAHFEGLWQSGAFDSQEPSEAQQLQEGRARDSAREASLRGEPREPARQAPEPRAVPAQQPEPVEPAQVAEPAAAAVAEEGPEFSDLDDYLTKSSIERDSFLTLPVTVKVDGKTSQVPLADVLKSYQLEQHFQAKSIGFAEQQRNWEANAAQARQQLEGQLSQAQALGTLAKQTLLGEYHKIDWNRLQAEDPGRWSALQLEFGQKSAAIDQQLGAVQQQQMQMARANEAQRLAQLPKERELMLEKRPEWQDEKVFQAARTQMVGYAKSLGFSDADIASIFDHRQMLVLDQAARFAAAQAQVPSALKKVRAAPQVSSPGARISRDPQRAAATQANAAWKKSGYRDQAAGAAVFETLV